MIRIEVDFNHYEDQNTIIMTQNTQSLLGKELKDGTRVILHEPGIECEAILRRGTTFPWVAKIIEGTIKQLPHEE